MVRQRKAVSNGMRPHPQQQLAGKAKKRKLHSSKEYDDAVLQAARDIARTAPADVVTILHEVTSSQSREADGGFRVPSPRMPSLHSKDLPLQASGNAAQWSDNINGTDRRGNSSAGDSNYLSILLGYSDADEPHETFDGVKVDTPGRDAMDDQLQSFMDELKSTGLLEGEGMAVDGIAQQSGQEPEVIAGTAGAATVAATSPNSLASRPSHTEADAQQQPNGRSPTSSSSGDAGDSPQQQRAEQRILGAVPDCPLWFEVEDTATHKLYYWHNTTNEVRWDRPQPQVVEPPSVLVESPPPVQQVEPDTNEGLGGAEAPANPPAADAAVQPSSEQAVPSAVPALQLDVVTSAALPGVAPTVEERNGVVDANVPSEIEEAGADKGESAAHTLSLQDIVQRLQEFRQQAVSLCEVQLRNLSPLLRLAVELEVRCTDNAQLLSCTRDKPSTNESNGALLQPYLDYLHMVENAAQQCLQISIPEHSAAQPLAVATGVSEQHNANCCNSPEEGEIGQQQDPDVVADTPPPPQHPNSAMAVTLQPQDGSGAPAAPNEADMDLDMDTDDPPPLPTDPPPLPVEHANIAAVPLAAAAVPFEAPAHLPPAAGPSGTQLPSGAPVAAGPSGTQLPSVAGLGTAVPLSVAAPVQKRKQYVAQPTRTISPLPPEPGVDLATPISQPGVTGQGDGLSPTQVSDRSALQQQENAVPKRKKVSKLPKSASGLISKWQTVRKELEPSEEELYDAQDPVAALERKKQKELEEWKSQALKEGSVERNANFQPLGTDWRSKVKVGQQSRHDGSVAAHDPGVLAANKGLPAGWKAMRDKDSGQIYYGNLATRVTTWQRPV